ncbi:MAG: helix-turn-helix domain-containing protein [Spirochaetales bacterium]|nr:helix-turn-helix domain-containing protein [Spirochaetales bacterium]
MLMTSKIIHRSRVLEMVDQNSITLKEASQLINLSYRHLRRLYQRYKQKGYSGLIHGLHGRTSNRKIKENIHNNILTYYKKNFPGCCPTQAAQKLSCLGYAVSRETLKRWLLKAGIWSQKQKQSANRSNRNSNMNFGETILLFSRTADWLGKKIDESCLLSLVDKATGTILSLMAEQETVQAAMQILWLWTKKYGIPMNICCEGKYIYKADYKPATGHNIFDEKPKTGFFASCNTLGPEIIVMRRSQIKQHLPENFSIYTKKLLKQLRSAKINNIQEANKLMSNGFLNNFNKPFAENYNYFQDFHVRLREENNLSEIICFSSKKPVSGKRTIEYENRLFRITEDNPLIPRPHSEVVVKEWLNGSVHILYKKYELKVKEIINK